MRFHYEKILKDTEKAASHFLQIQVLDNDSENYGGFINEYELVEPKFAIAGFNILFSLVKNKDSKFYQDQNIYERLEIALDYIRKFQREDGTFDLLACNFYSAPDTAFCLKMLLPSFQWLTKFAVDERDIAFRDTIKNIIKNAADGIIIGGFHTPNHRWAIASALMASYNFFKKKEYREVVDAYLAEGIDGNEYGEYAERSAGNYNRVNNDSMILLAEETGDESYLDYVERNLEMMYSYFEPDGSIFTNNSTRQDRGKKVYPTQYYYEYLYMAYKRNRRDFAAAADKIIRIAEDKNVMVVDDFLMLLMNSPELIDFETPAGEFPTAYHKYYKDSGIVRAMKGNFSYSVIKNDRNFFHFQKGALKLSLRIGVRYFEQRAFTVQDIDQTEDGYRLHYQANGWYYTPFKDYHGTSDWWKMDNASREKVKGPTIEIFVTIKELTDGVSLHLTTAGCDRVPLRIAFSIDAVSSIKTDVIKCDALAGHAITVSEGMLHISKDGDSIQVGPAFAKHNFVDYRFDSETLQSPNFDVYFTEFTNCDRTITITSE